MHSNHSTQATSSGVLGGVNGVSVFPGLRQSRLSNLRRKSPLKHPNITLLSCDISERDTQLNGGCGWLCACMCGYMCVCTYIHICRRVYKQFSKYPLGCFTSLCSCPTEGNSTLRKSSRQCISKAISYREEALNRCSGGAQT